jgi:hypothetical protein
MKSHKQEMIASSQGTVNSILTDSLNKIDKNLNTIHKQHELDFSKAFNKAKNKLDKMINGNDYFSYGKYFKKEQNPPQRHKRQKRSSFYVRRRSSIMTLLSLNNNNNNSQCGNNDITLLTPVEHNTYNKLSLLSPLHRNSISNTKTPQHTNATTTNYNRRNTLFSQPYDKEFIMNLSKFHSQFISTSNEEKTTTSNNSLPLILKTQDKNLKTFLLEHKTTKNQRRKGGVINSPIHTTEFLEALKQFAYEQNSPTFMHKNFIKKAIYDQVHIPRSVLRKIYMKCVYEIQNGEHIDNYLLRTKSFDKVNKEKREKIINIGNQQLEDMLLIDDSKDQKKTNLLNLFEHQSELTKLKERDLNRKFLNKVKRLDVIPKISETLAFKNRSGYFSEFDYDYTNDGDFLFMKEFNKVRTASVNVDEFGNEIKHDKHSNNNNNSEQGVEHMLDESEKNKNLLIRHIEDSQMKYKQKGYLTLKHSHDNHRNNNNMLTPHNKRNYKHKREQYININNYTKYMMKNTYDKAHKGRNTREYFNTFRKTNSMPFIFASAST